MTKRIFKLLLGNTIASFGITCLIKSGLGCFSVTAANIALANWFCITVGISGMILELIMLTIATRMGEGIGVTSIVNATYGSILIDVFNLILPTGTWMVFGLVIAPIGWSLMGKAGLGDTGSNILMNALLKKTKKSIKLIRGIQELVLLIVGFLGARNQVTFFTLILTLGLGYLLEFEYKILKYDPSKVKHSFLIKGKNK